MSAGKKAVSEVVAAIMLSLIIVSLGALILLNHLNQTRAQERSLEDSIDRLRNLANEALFDIAYTYYNTTPGQERLETVVTTGPGLVQIVGIYVNNTLVWKEGDPGAELDGTPVTGPLILESTSIHTIKVHTTLPLSPGDTYTLTIATSTGVKRSANGEAH